MAKGVAYTFAHDTPTSSAAGIPPLQRALTDPLSAAAAHLPSARFLGEGRRHVCSCPAFAGRVRRSGHVCSDISPRAERPLRASIRRKQRRRRTGATWPRCDQCGSFFCLRSPPGEPCLFGERKRDGTCFGSLFIPSGGKLISRLARVFGYWNFQW